uniref:Uncharacterized protein n=1 Tax=Romanomermis culicivorax TaxID=13658 RepID=A0A915K7Z5_ROMCU
MSTGTDLKANCGENMIARKENKSGKKGSEIMSNIIVQDKMPQRVEVKVKKMNGELLKKEMFEFKFHFRSDWTQTEEVEHLN